MSNIRLTLASGSNTYKIKTVKMAHSEFVVRKQEFDTWIRNRKLDVTWGYKNDSRRLTMTVLFETVELAKSFVETFGNISES
jgi:aromatic ring-opening dioxygenase catalytic subunit (LigB family)